MLRRLFILALTPFVLGLIPTPAHATDIDLEKDMNATANREQHDAEVQAAVGYVAHFFGAYLDGIAAHERAEEASRQREAGDSAVTTRSTKPPRPSAAPSSDRHYSCPEYASDANPSGDFAVPCYIIGRESHGNYGANNPTSSAQGAYQIMGLDPNTPPAEQDRIARGMALCNWNPPNYCAGG